MTHDLRLTCLEVEPWQEHIIQRSFPNARVSQATIDSVTDLGDPEALVIFIYSKIGPDELDRMPHLKYITTMSTGFDHIDLAACHQRGIIVSNVPTYGEQTVAEHTLALLLTLSRNIIPSVNHTQKENFSIVDLRGTDLGEKTAGVVGTGRIGKHVITMLKGIGMNVIAHDPYPDPATAQRLGFTYVDLDFLLKNADVVTLHCPATKDNTHLLTEKKLQLMKQDSFLINTARGDLLDTAALVRILGTGHLAGVGLDVLEEESEMKDGSAKKHLDATMKATEILLRHPRVIVTPHNAFNSHESIRRIMKTTLDNLEAYINGAPMNIIQK